MDGDLAAALAAVLGAPVADLARLSGGASRETWSFTAGPDRLILQRRRPGASALATGVDHEVGLLRAAAGVGVPVPEVVAWDGTATTAVGGPFIVTRRVDGEALPRTVLGDPALADARGRLVADVGAALAAVHRIDPGVLADGENVPAPPDVLDGLDAVLTSVRGARPVLALALRHLRLTRPPARPPVVTHGDLRLGNLLVAPPGLAAVLDWELAHLGDPAEDLGWCCVRAWRFGAPGRVAGVGGAEDLLAAYRAAGGVDVSLDELAWWELYGTVRWGVICAVQAEAHLSGAVRSLELAAIGRRAAEAEYDALFLMGVAVPEAAPDEATAAVHDAPSAAELVAAVRQLLADDVRPELTGALRYGVTVATRVLAQVERELAAGAAPTRAHAEALAALGAEDDAALVAALAAGRHDDGLAGVAAALAPTVAAKLAVTNPGYRAPA